MELNCKGKIVSLDRPRVMGVLNLTPDSFSDGGLWNDPERACAHAYRMVDEGAALIDIGGESTRPNAEEVPVEEELRRVIPVVEQLSGELPVPISVDTSKPEVMRAAVAAGAGMINDVYALRMPGALKAAAECGVPICLMHMQGEPRNMQQNPHYDDVVVEVRDFLLQRAAACESAGIATRDILLDPGFGFGKTVLHNLLLAGALKVLVQTGYGVLAGFSRKSTIGHVLGGAPVDARLNGGIALATLASWQGVQVIRTHDVRATVEALQLVAAVRDADQGQGDVSC